VFAFSKVNVMNAFTNFGLRVESAGFGVFLFIELETFPFDVVSFLKV
jgi:hypothetical protein